MSRPKLKTYWDRWRRKRKKEFRAFGFELSVADDIARCEAEMRQRIEVCAGQRAALQAELAVVPNADGSERIVLSIDPNLIDDADCDSAVAALGLRFSDFAT